MSNDLSAYYAVRKDMETGDLLQWHSRSMIGAAIRWKIGGEVNHSGLVLRLAEYESAEGRRWTSEALEDGVHAVLLSRRLEAHDGKVWWHKLKPQYHDLRGMIGTRMMQQLGVKYDFGSLFRQLFAKASVDLAALFCSEYCYWCVGGEKGKAPNPAEIIQMGGFWDPEGMRIL